jgi:heme-degrading monooxygenase HmoA
MHATLTNLTVRESDFEDYLALRRDSVNPAMREWPGCEGSMLLRRREVGPQGGIALTLVNLFDTAETQREWAESKLHVEVKRPLAGLVSSTAYRLHRRLDDISVTVGSPTATRMAAIGVHHVAAGRSVEYLARRRDIVHPSMSGADGFIGTWVFNDPDDADRFFCFFQWESDPQADAYFNSAEHRGPVVNAVASICVGSVASTRYDVVPVDEPWGAMAAPGSRALSPAAV